MKHYKETDLKDRQVALSADSYLQKQELSGNGNGMFQIMLADSGS